ncbi:HXXEE domain-containing protein [Rummeliibacillus sp. NPDC094406]|uniref:HXXEE domain-containing protein n=1 Tax=Rummeliibacillus sp. NPDC094406 TaxID=3364511 RepID=UPI003815B63E
MNNMQVIIWLFPILFMFHDFEEIIFMRAWINKNRSYMSERFPTLSKKLLPHFEHMTTSAFALGVAEEFILISTITVISYMTNWYDLWIGSFIAFTLHLLIHCFQALIVRKYIPVIVTSIICLPICIYIIMQILQISSLYTIILYSILCFIIMIINISIVHKLMAIFSQWIVRYEHK